MAGRMRAAVVRAFRTPLTIEEVPIPTPGPGEVLVKIVATGVCHTDLHAANGDWPVKPTPPFTPGHEGAGIVAAVGASVRHLKEGDPVGIAWLHDACGRCEYCTTGWETLCESQHMSGYTVNGSFAEYAIGNADYVGRLPEKVDFAAMAPILCAGVTTYKGIKETEAKPGDWLAISGIGGLGHVAVQYAKAMGLHVVALDVSEEKLALARSLGADLAIDARSPEAAAKTIKETGGGAHGVLVTAVSIPAFNQALKLVRRKGTISLTGLPPGEFATPIFDVVLKRITIRGSIVGTRKDLAEAIAFAAEGNVRAHIHTAKLDNINDVFKALEAGIMFCDLYGFTQLSNRLSSDRVLSLLNAYFDQVVPSVMERGGEVLKFMGDGLLALFCIDGRPERSCAAALEAAQKICRRLKAVTVPDARLEAGIGLHFGEVSYGNIGSGERLDFTVIGRDVNLASRIQGLCRELSKPVLMSKRFSSLVGSTTISVGGHHLKGFDEPVELLAPVS